MNDSNHSDLIPLSILIEYHIMGFKLVPLREDGKTPNVKGLLTQEECQKSIDESGDGKEHPVNYIHDHSEFWSKERLEREHWRFKNVATTYGKTRLKDEEGKDLYLKELDIDDEEIFTRLSIVKVKDKDHYFLDEIGRQTFGVQTRKKWGRRYYWFSHHQEKPIRSNDCKIGHKFEIKEDNSTGHGTLPPSRFRNDATMHYQSIGQNRIAIMDGMYDGLLKTLDDCLIRKENKKHHLFAGEHNKMAASPGRQVDLSEEDINEIIQEIIDYYQEGNRNHIVYGLSGLLFKKGITLESCKRIVERLCENTNDSETNNRILTLSNTYEKGNSGQEIEGSSGLSQTFVAFAGEEKARETMDHLLIILNKYGNTVLNQLNEDIRRELSNHTFEPISYNPMKFVIAHKDNKQILHGSINFRQDYNNISNNERNQTGSYSSILSQSPSTHLVSYDSVIINAIPTKIIKYEDPTSIETKYEIDFENNLGNKFHIDPKSLKDTLDELKLKGLVYKVRAAEEALPAILNAFQRDGKVLVKREVETPGFYLVGGNIVANKIELPKIPVSQEDLSKCAHALIELSKRSKRLDFFGTIISWALIAPFSFVLKQLSEDGYEKWLPWIYRDGPTNTGKTTEGRIVLAIWRKHKDKKIHDIGFASADTLPRFGRAISYDTFLVLINEVTLNDERQKQLVEALKHAVQSETVRARLMTRSTAEHISALSPCFLTSNDPPPDDPAFGRRIIRMRSSWDEILTQEEITEFNNFRFSNNDTLGILGDFTMDYILKNQDLLKNSDWKSAAITILTDFFKSAGVQVPEWVGKFVEDSDIQDIYAENEQIVRGFFIKKINDTFTRFFNTLKPDDRNMDRTLDLNKLEDRLWFCCNMKQLIPFLRTNKEGDKILILSDILKDLKDNRISVVSRLSDLAEMFQTSTIPVTINGKSVRVISISKQKFLDFLIPPILS